MCIRDSIKGDGKAGSQLALWTVRGGVVTVENLESVSYTHLDVYKRQVQ